MAEHVIGIDARMEAGLPSLDGAADVVEATGKDKVGEGPRHGLVVGDRLEPMSRRHAFPQRAMRDSHQLRSVRPCS